MKIIDVEAIWLRVPTFQNSAEWGDDAFVIRIHTDSGLSGGLPTRHECARHAVLQTEIFLLPLLLGEQIFHEI